MYLAIQNVHAPYTLPPAWQARNLSSDADENTYLNMVALLDDAVIEIGTQEILPDPSKSRAQIQTMIKRKERAVAHISTKYLSASLTKDDIERCLYSICDNNRRARSLFERARAPREAPPPLLARAQLSQFESAADRQDDRAAQ